MSPVQRRDGEPAAAGRPARDDGATFTGAIAGQRGRPPMVLVAFVVAIAALVVVGIGGQQAGITSSSPAPGTAAAAATPTAAATAEPISTPMPAETAFVPAQAPIVASAPGSELALTIRRHPETLFVHGDVYPAGVTWVFVNVLDVEGRVGAWHQVSIPGGAGVPPEGKPAMRFDVELALPPWATGPVWVQGTAYDGTGSVVAQEKLGVWADGEPMSTGGGAGEADANDQTILRLESPAAGAAAITAATITVAGTLQIRASTVEVSLMTADRRLVSSRTVETADPDGGIRPRSSPKVNVLLGIPGPRPTGVQAWIVITAFDEDGTAIAYQRRAVTIAPLSATAGAPAAFG